MAEENPKDIEQNPIGNELQVEVSEVEESSNLAKLPTYLISSLVTELQTSVPSKALDVSKSPNVKLVLLRIEQVIFK